MPVAMGRVLTSDSDRIEKSFKNVDFEK